MTVDRRVLLVGTLLAGSLLGAGAVAEDVTTSPKLDSARYAATAIWNGSFVYVFGGHEDGPTNTIRRYNPAEDRLRVMNATLPTDRENVSAVWADSRAFVLGGFNKAPLDEILRYNTANDRVKTLDATLPSGIHSASAVWTGEAVYLFGGRNATGLRDEIVRFDPASGTVETVNATLAKPREGTTAIWTGERAYVFGGKPYTDLIQRFDPETTSVTNASISLPSPRGFAGSAWDGRRGYVVGGKSGGASTALAEILLFEPFSVPRTIEKRSVTLPEPRFLAATAWDGRRVDVFGGLNGTGQATQTLLRYDPPNTRPEANFTVAVDERNVTVDATPSQDIDGEIVAYAWFWGDGNTSTGLRANHTYAKDGTYSIDLTVQDDSGANRTTTRTVNVSDNTDPTAKFSVDTDQLTVTLDASASSDPDGKIAAYEWDLGDGSTATGATVTHTYDGNGSYTIRLNVTDDRGATATTSTSVTVSRNVEPNAAFDVTWSGLTGTFDASGSGDPDGEIAAYRWTFGDGSQEQTGRTVEHTYASEGRYNVTLTVEDDQGATATATRRVNARLRIPPEVDFDVTVDDLQVGVTAEPSTDPDGSIVSFTWSFGDGSPNATGLSASHTYPSGGTYEIRLVAVDDAGLRNSTTKTVEVKAPGFLGTGVPIWAFAAGGAGAAAVAAWHTGVLGGVLARVRGGKDEGGDGDGEGEGEGGEPKKKRKKPKGKKKKKKRRKKKPPEDKPSKEGEGGEEGGGEEGGGEEGGGEEQG